MSNDFSIASPILISECSWKVLKNPYGSDQFTITLERKVPLPGHLIRMPRRKLNNRDWTLFWTKFSLNPMSSEESNRYVTKTVIDAATMSIPLTSCRLSERYRASWSQGCEVTRKRQNSAWQFFANSPQQMITANLKVEVITPGGRDCKEN